MSAIIYYINNMIYERHHLLEIILWHNEDGTFREIRNSRARLREFGIYDDWKLCITIPRSEHCKLHMTGRYVSPETRAKMSLNNCSKRKEISEARNAKNRGQKRTEETKQKLRDAWKRRKLRKS